MYTFRISYFAEISAELVMREVDGYVEITATHTNPNVGISDWFHFVDKEVNHDPLIVTAGTMRKALAVMADKLYPGVKSLLIRKDDVDNPKEQFYTDFFIAFALNEYHPRRVDVPNDKSHPAGEWLMNQKV